MPFQYTANLDAIVPHTAMEKDEQYHLRKVHPSSTGVNAMEVFMR